MDLCLKTQQPQKQKVGVDHSAGVAAADENTAPGNEVLNDASRQNTTDLGSKSHQCDATLQDAEVAFAQEMRARTDAVLAREAAVAEREAVCAQVSASSKVVVVAVLVDRA